MPRYLFGDTVVRRKNLYMPCAIGPRYDEASDEEQARILKETYWADFIAAAEWRALLREPGFTPSAKSRLKKKATGWIQTLGRIYTLDPDLYHEIFEAAKVLYRDQIGSENPILNEDRA